MTFEEALEKKKSYPNEFITINNTRMKILVVPTLEIDMHPYAVYFDIDKTTDDVAKRFCTNNIYQVLAVAGKVPFFTTCLV